MIWRLQNIPIYSNVLTYIPDHGRMFVLITYRNVYSPIPKLEVRPTVHHVQVERSIPMVVHIVQIIHIRLYWIAPMRFLIAPRQVPVVVELRADVRNSRRVVVLLFEMTINIGMASGREIHGIDDIWGGSASETTDGIY